MRDLADPKLAGARGAWRPREVVDFASGLLHKVRRRLSAANRLRAELDRRADVIRAQAAALAHSRKIIDRSSAQAKIGVWECELPSNRLFWTDGVYDLYELPRGAPVTRESVLALYDPESVATLNTVRSAAIAARGTFSLDVRITTAKGNARWIRLTADVEVEDDRPVRLFGMQQDITEERALLDELRMMAERDPLTGLSNRNVLETVLLRESRGVLLLIDLDGFKQINDTYGHAAGDACLCQVATRLLRGAPDTLVARIGGDEFAIVIEGVSERCEIEMWTAGLLADLSRTYFYKGVALDLGASIGAAVFDVETGARAAFVEADLALYAAKAAGKRTFRIFSKDMATAPAFRPLLIEGHRRSA